jgi:hypothetical protein
LVTALVRPGKTAHVAIAVPPGQTEGLVSVPLDVVIGDGSFDAFCAAWGRRDRPEDADDPESMWFWQVYEKLEIDCRLSPVAEASQEPKGRNRWGEKLTKGTQRVVLADVAPGEYALEVVNLLAWEAASPLFQRTIRVAAGEPPQPVRVSLPDSSIDLELRHPTEKPTAQVMYGLFRDGQKQPFRVGGFSGVYASEDEPRREAVHFVPPGRYEILIWQDVYGWLRSGPIDVEPGQVAGAGALTFRPGATVTGRLHLDQEARMPAYVELVDSTGVRRRAELRWTGKEFTFQAEALWPGRWIARVVGEEEDERALAEKAFQVRGVASVEIDMKGR